MKTGTHKKYGKVDILSVDGKKCRIRFSISRPPFHSTRTVLASAVEVEGSRKGTQSLASLEGIIDRLARKRGYPAIKLDHSAYLKVLREAHEIKYGKEELTLEDFNYDGRAYDLYKKGKHPAFIGGDVAVKTKILIRVDGGNITGVYTNNKDVQIVTADFDNLEGGGDKLCSDILPPEAVSENLYELFTDNTDKQEEQLRDELKRIKF